MAFNRREWLHKSLLGSSALLLPYSSFDTHEDKKILDEILRLHWNENPYGPSPNVIEAVKSSVEKANLYWDEKNDELREKMAKIHGLKTDQYLVTSGSTEILTLLGQHVGLQRGEIVTGSDSFPTIEMFGERCGARISKVPMSNYRLDLDRMKSAINTETKLVFICNPNNPTSTELDQSQLKSFCRSVPDNVLIAVDEAYIELSDGGAGSSLIPLINELPNLIICRTFSKVYGLAGFRLGYAISQSHNIAALRNRYPALGMAPGLLPLVAGITALGDQSFVNHVVSEVNKGKDVVYKAFNNWGVIHPRSSTNFIYAEDKGFVHDVRGKLRSHNILITKWPSMTDHIRISIGRPEWMEKLVQEMEGLRKV